MPPPPPAPPTSAEEPRPAPSSVESETSEAFDNGSATTTTNYFCAERWDKQFGTEHFVPWAGNQSQTIPSRQPTPTEQKARPIKRPKPIQRQTTSSAPREYVVIEDDDDEEHDSSTKSASGTQRPQQTEAEPADMNGFAEPVAMEIDSPPAVQSNAAGPDFTQEKATGEFAGNTSATNGSPIRPDSQAQSNAARNIPVEPTRPEWRAGDAQRAAFAAAAATAATSGSTAKPAGGSEDSDEFRASLADIRKVEPISEVTAGIHGHAGTGLASFGDLQSNLPFESKAASATPVPPRGSGGNSTNYPGVGRGGGGGGGAGRRKDISFPKAPVPPNPPPALAVPGLQPTASAWEKYVTEFRHYMQEWTVFNNIYLDHFMARRHNIERHDAYFDWITDADSDNDGINQYLDSLELDEEIHARWSSSCSGHDMEVRKFMAFREHMRQSS